MFVTKWTIDHVEIPLRKKGNNNNTFFTDHDNLPCLIFQSEDEYTRIIQGLRRKTFCLSILVIFLMFGVVTLAILISWYNVYLLISLRSYISLAPPSCRGIGDLWKLHPIRGHIRMTLCTNQRKLWLQEYENDTKLLYIIRTIGLARQCFFALSFKNWSQFVFGSWRNKLNQVLHTMQPA
jgi:hypothetical protein